MSDNTEILTSEITANSSRGQLLQATSVFIIDEAPAGNKAIFSCIDECLRLVTLKNEPFGGKIVILVGDFRQTGPIIRFGSRSDIVNASLTRSPIWPLFQVERLYLPIRNVEDPEFANFVDDIGDGAGPEVTIPFVESTTSKEDFINFVFPNEILREPSICLTRCILAPTNKQVNYFNKKILMKLDTEPKTYYATDSIKETDELDPEYDIGLLNLDHSSILDLFTTQTPPGLPPHSLQLKTGSICRLMRNFSIDNGLVKNARVLITLLGTHIIAVRKIILIGNEGRVDADDILIPRIHFHHHLHSGYTLIRKQFPLTLAYASTFNSCQGLTLDKIGCDLTIPVFSHGQLYTALSRIKKRQDAIILFKDNQTTTTNVTYEEILLDQ